MASDRMEDCRCWYWNAMQHQMSQKREEEENDDEVLVAIWVNIVIGHGQASFI